MRRLSIRQVLFWGWALMISGLTLGATSEKSAEQRGPASASSQEAAEQTAEFKSEAAAAPLPVPGETACLAGAATLEDLRAQRARLAEKEKELSAKEAELTALKAAIQEEFERLEGARSDIARMDELKKKENEEKVAKIVETVEAMSPKAASQMFAQLDEALAVTAMQRLATPKLAKMMNLMEPKRSSRLTELLAGVVRARGQALPSVSLGAAATTTNPGKGGESKNGNSEQRAEGAGRKPVGPGSSEKAGNAS